MGKTEVPKTHIDDEYGDSGIIDPIVCVTTSRDPSSTLKQFAKEIKLMFPHSTRINRGNVKVQELISSCKEAEFSDIIILHETMGNPDGMVVCHLPLGPTAYFTLTNSVLRHDLKTKAAPMSEAFPHIILNNFNTNLGKRIGNVLKCLFPIPRNESHRIVTFSNDNDFISFRHHMYTKEKIDKVTLYEVAPRFEMRLYQLKLGTIDQKDAENEYILRPYHNTAQKRNIL